MGIEGRLQHSYSALAEEHRAIILLLERLGHIHHPIDLAAPIEELHRVLVAHFAHEQFPGGLYESMGAFGSEHHERVRELVGQHCQILAHVGRLVERARAAKDAQGLMRDVRQLIALIRGHEQKEHELANVLLLRGQAKRATA